MNPLNVLVCEFVIMISISRMTQITILIVPTNRGHICSGQRCQQENNRNSMTHFES